MSFFNEDRIRRFLLSLQKKANTRFARYGLPFLIFMIGGSFGLKSFTSLRYEYSNVVTLKPEEAAKLGIEMKKPGEVTLESVYDQIKDADLDSWTNIRGPRPWEQGEES